MNEVDFFVIGGGSGGVRAARVAASHGARVALAEEYRVGGTCVIRGCVPKKMMVLASRFSDAFDEASDFGWNVDHVEFDWSHLARGVAGEVARLESVYTTNLERAGIELLKDRAVMEDAHTVRLVASGARFRARHVLVATGASPVSQSDLFGAEHIEDSNRFFEWTELPQRVVVLGGGYIALELASLLRRLGSHVELVFRADMILRGFDEEVREHLQRQMNFTGVVLHPGRTVKSVALHGRSHTIALDNGTVLEADRVLGATGRVPNTRGLGLESIGVRLSARGAVLVDDRARSSVPHIHAVGDVTDRLMLTPAAIREGQALAESLFGSKVNPVRHDTVPTAIFTSPEVGVVGLNEDQAVKQYQNVDVFSTNFRPMTAVLSSSPRRTMMKLLVHREDDRLLGAHMVGEDAAEMIQLLGVLVNMGARKRDLDATLPVHPCAAEEWLTLRTPVRRHGAVATF